MSDFLRLLVHCSALIRIAGNASCRLPVKGSGDHHANLSAVAFAIVLAVADFPATPAGALASKYFQVYNTADEAATIAFLNASITEQARGRRTPEQRLDAYRQLRRRIGNVAVDSVTTTDTGQLAVTVSASAGGHATFTFTFAGTPPLLEGFVVVIPPEG